MQNKPAHKDNCGTGILFSKNNTSNHYVISRSILSLNNMKHRGAVSHDGETPDGCGILLDLDTNFFQKIMLDEQKLILPSHFGIGVFFVNDSLDFLKILEQICHDHDIDIIAIRHLKINKKLLGEVAKKTCPKIYHLFVKPKTGNEERLEINLYKIKKLLDKKFNPEKELYCVSFSSETIVYKGLVQPKYFSKFYKDLSDPEHKSASAVFHIRFSTNTSPKWYLAQPYRVLAHNGEINTISGNRNWAQARTKIFSSKKLGNLSAYEPLIGQSGSDSSSLDHILDLFTNGGINIGRAARMLIPPSWQNTDLMDADEKAFHEYNSMHMEAWDGPAFVCYQSKLYAACFLDRNGLRPARIEIFDDGTVSVASEVGSNYTSGIKPINTGRLGPGGLMLFDRATNSLLLDEEVDKVLSRSNPYRYWLKQKSKHLEANLHEYSGPQMREISNSYFEDSAKTFQLSKEEISTLFQYSEHGGEPTGSMGDDTPLAPISQKIRSIYDFCRQKFAQVTNPPIDSLREKSAMSLETCIGPELNIFEETAEHANRIVVNSPILSHKKFNLLIKNKKFKTARFLLEYERNDDLGNAINKLLDDIVNAVKNGLSIVILDEKQITKNKPVINALLMTSALHYRLIKENLRVKANIIVNTASARDNHQIACLIGFGATCVHPWLGLQTILKQSHKSNTDLSTSELCVSYRKSLNKGLLKIMSKMGISNVSSYRGAGLFEVVGFSDKVNKLCFPKNFSYIKGECFEDLHLKSLASIDGSEDDNIIAKGLHKYVHDGEQHAYNPDIVSGLQKSLENNSFSGFQNFTNLIDNRNPLAVRDFFEVASKRKSIDISEVEPIEDILKRFDSAGMSLGALSPEAHETLAEAMNELGARSNSGEGGEALERYGTNKMSKIKQVASGRFGVTPAYLVNAEVLQIKIAQGAKPGEGGQLPGGKVNSLIAKLRYSTPGITLISPPPHHDIYSIEDLAQLIFDLKQVNPKALVSVKLVSEPGVGTIAVGVAKAYADLITISGHDGGTGASPLSSIRHAGSPWELGLAETHQALRNAGLRGQVRIQADGGLKTGLDVVKAAILGAESFGFGTGPMISMGCKYLRICHLNNCATGVATQRKDIISNHFVGEKERVKNYFRFIAQDVRDILAEIGHDSLESIVGKTSLLNEISEAKDFGLSLDPLLYEDKNLDEPHTCIADLNDPWDKANLSQKALNDLKKTITSQQINEVSYQISNRDRSFGAKISGFIAMKYGEKGCSKTQTINLQGNAGQSLGAWNANGLNISLEGDANDYVGKGMNGGRIIIHNSADYAQKKDPSILIGNTALYGATGGELYVAGTAGERFAVRNSGASAVIEGAGDHCCEYMTGGNIVVLGDVGNNFGAGMTGGFAYVLDMQQTFFDKCNRSLINLERIVEEEMEPHRQFLKTQIKKHIKYTNSYRSKEILEDFDKFESRFWLISPKAISVKDLLKATTASAA